MHVILHYNVDRRLGKHLMLARITPILQCRPKVLEKCHIGDSKGESFLMMVNMFQKHFPGNKISRSTGDVLAKMQF